MRSIKSFRNSYFLVVFLSLLPLFNLSHPGLPITHDGIDHVARVANFYADLSQGIFIPRWASNLNWGYGHPILMFLYPLSSYFTSLFHFVGFSFIDSLKLVFAVSYILSGIFMFAWLKNFLGEKAGLVGAVLYLFAPYRFVDLYVRGAIGEHMAFVFLPLVLYGIYKINKNKLSYSLFLLTSFSFAGLVLSHNAISLIFIPFILFYIFYLYFEERSNSKIILALSSLFLGLLFSFFFWFPAFMEGKYTLRDIVTKGVYQAGFIDPKSLIVSRWGFGNTGGFSLEIGTPHILLSFFSLLLVFKKFGKKDNLKILLLGSFVFGIASVFLMTYQSHLIWEKVTILQKLQFPWRFLSMTVFLTSLIGAIAVYKLNLSKLKVRLLIILTILITLSYWHPKSYQVFPQSLFVNPYPSTTDTGESAPIWSVRFMEKFPKDQIELISGNAEIKKVSRKVNDHKYIINNSEKVRVKENTLYFPGWVVYDNGKLINIQFQDPKNRGLITFYLEAGIHNVSVRFEETKLRSLSNIVSIAFLLSSLILFLFLKLLKNKI